MSSDFNTNECSPERRKQLEAFERRDKYIFEKFGECKEPVYDPFLGTWILGSRNTLDGGLCYLMGSAEKIFGEFFGCREDGHVDVCFRYLYANGEKKMVKSYGDIDALFRSAWQEADVDCIKELQDNGLLSQYQRDLWQKAYDYAQEHRCG